MFGLTKSNIDTGHCLRGGISTSNSFAGHQGRTVADSIAERLKRPNAYKFRQIAVSFLSWYTKGLVSIIT